MMTTTTTQEKSSHAKFWAMLKDMPGYMYAHRLELKCSLVYQWSSEQTLSLREFYQRDPDGYSNMLIDMYRISHKRRQEGLIDLDMWRKRVMAVIASYLDEEGRVFASKGQKIAYIMTIAARIAGVGREDDPAPGRFNKISITKLTAIYNAFLTKNKITKKVMDL